MPVPRVIDLSHHNSIPEDLQTARAEGIIGCIHKLTEGSSMVDDKVQARYFLAREAGLAWGLYHFLRPGDMVEQARHFLDTAYELGVIDAETVLVADHEDQSVTGQELKQWLDIVEEMTSRSPVVYSGHVLKEQLEGSGYVPVRRLWLCQYAAQPVLPDGVESYWLWQYTDQGDGELYGIEGYVDLNDIGDQDGDDFLAGWSGAYEKPIEPDVPLVTISSDMPVRLQIGGNIEIV